LLTEVRPLAAVYEAYFPGIQNNACFLYKTNSTTSRMVIRGVTLITKDEFIKVTGVHEDEEGLHFVVKGWVATYYNGTLTSNDTLYFIVNIPKKEYETSLMAGVSYFFNVKKIKNAIAFYLNGLLPFAGENATITIFNDTYNFKGNNRSVICGVLNGSRVYAKYIVDKEYGVLLEKVVVKYEITGGLGVREVSEYERTVLAYTTLPLKRKEEKHVDIVLIATVACILILIIVVVIRYRSVRSVMMLTHLLEHMTGEQERIEFLFHQLL